MRACACVNAYVCVLLKTIHIVTAHLLLFKVIIIIFNRRRVRFQVLDLSVGVSE